MRRVILLIQVVGQSQVKSWTFPFRFKLFIFFCSRSGCVIFSWNSNVHLQHVILVYKYVNGRYFTAQIACTKQSCMPRLIWQDGELHVFQQILWQPYWSKESGIQPFCLIWSALQCVYMCPASLTMWNLYLVLTLLSMTTKRLTKGVNAKIIRLLMNYGQCAMCAQG